MAVVLPDYIVNAIQGLKAMALEYRDSPDNNPAPDNFQAAFDLLRNNLNDNPQGLQVAVNTRIKDVLEAVRSRWPFLTNNQNSFYHTLGLRNAAKARALQQDEGNLRLEDIIAGPPPQQALPILHAGLRRFKRQHKKKSRKHTRRIRRKTK
jgi:hypothetical protein